MPTRQFTSFLARFLDSRAPALFIVGSLVLGLFSNAVYGLILVVLGDSPWTLMGIVVASVVILPHASRHRRDPGRATELRDRSGHG